MSLLPLCVQMGWLSTSKVALSVEACRHILFKSNITDKAGRCLSVFHGRLVFLGTSLECEVAHVSINKYSFRVSINYYTLAGCGASYK
jgi:hypothetical protein